MLFEKALQFLKRPTFQNIGRLMTATVLAQVVSILISPVVTRLYSSTDYGFLALMMSFSTLAGTIATFQYNQTIILAKEEEQAKLAFSLSLWLSFCVAVFTEVVGLFVIPFFPKWFDFNPAYKVWLYFLPVIIFISSAGNSSYFWANRNQHFSLISQGRMLISVTSAAISVGLGFLLDGPSGLILGFFIGTSIFSLFMWIGNIRKGLGSLPLRDIEGMKKLALKYKDFPLMNLPTQFIQQLIQQLPVLLLTLYKGPSSAGLYNLCSRVLITPIQTIAGATGEVFQQRAASRYNANGECEQDYLKTTKGLALIGALPFLVLGLISPWLFKFVFGAEWVEAGRYAQVMSFMFYLRFVFGTVSIMYYVADKLRENLIIHLYFLASTFLIFFFGKDLSTVTLLLMYSMNFSAIYMLWGYRSWIFSKGEPVSVPDVGSN